MVNRRYRIPDFAQRYYFAVQDEEQKWSCKRKAPPLLLTEVKAHLSSDDDLLQANNSIALQMLEQAQHVFAGSPEVKVVGGIRALGYKWRYIEYIRSELQSLSEDDDSTYNPDGSFNTSSDVFSVRSNVSLSASEYLGFLPTFLEPYFGDKLFLDLLDDYEESKNALRAIGEHIYNTLDERYDCPCHVS